jgi:hypothetical protein
MCGVDRREGWERHSSLRIFIYVCGVCICININVCFVCIGCLVVWLLLTLARRRSHVVKLARRLTLSLSHAVAPRLDTPPTIIKASSWPLPTDRRTCPPSSLLTPCIIWWAGWQDHYLELHRLVLHPFLFFPTLSLSLSETILTFVNQSHRRTTFLFCFFQDTHHPLLKQRTCKSFHLIYVG